MRYISACILILLLTAGNLLFAQKKYSLNGNIQDSTTDVNMINSIIAVLNAKDSTLVNFTRAMNNGSFTIKNISSGEYILLISYPDFADFSEKFKLDSEDIIKNFGVINLTSKAKLLLEVVVKGIRTPIRIKGDTTEFRASSYVIQPNSKVEDLLRQLPGLQVDRNGMITAHGQIVNKVLLDGEEFFGDDPTLITKNIRGDMVDKIQLYDKKSELATFTGIDDGKKIKTLNVKLKEGKKNGDFGKIDLGIGNKKFNQEQLAYNRFSGKEKFALYGTMANTGAIGLAWQDSKKYGASDNKINMNNGSEIVTFGSNSDDLELFDGQYDGKGLPVSRTAGLHYDNKWSNDGQSINTNYKIGYLNVEGQQNSQTQNILPQSSIETNGDQSFSNSIFRRKLDVNYSIRVDNLSTLKLSFDATRKNMKTNRQFSSNSSNKDKLLNENRRDLSNNGDQSIIYANLLYNKKFNNPRRSITIELAEAFDRTEAKGDLTSFTRLFNATRTTDSLYIDQQKSSSIRNSIFNTSIIFSEPLTSSIAILFSYGIILNKSTANRRAFNRSQTGEYNVADPIFTNNYSLTQTVNQAGANFNFNKGKVLLDFGTKISDVSFGQRNLIAGSNFNRNFINWTPNLDFLLKSSESKYLKFTYKGNNIQPQIDQLQPVLVNNDPLNITVGNPNLTASFKHRFDLEYRSYKTLTGQVFSFGGGYESTINPISSSANVEPDGRIIYQHVNINDRSHLNFSSFTSLHKQFKKSELNLGLRLQFNGNSYYSYINEAINKTTSVRYSSQFSLTKYKLKQYNFSLSFGPNYTSSGSSLSTVNDDGIGFSAINYLTIDLPGKMEISSENTFLYRNSTKAFDERFSSFFVTVNLSKRFLKQENLKLSLACNDLLNENRGFTRTATSTLFVQNRYSVVNRYFMFSLVYDFSRMEKSNSK